MTEYTFLRMNEHAGRDDRPSRLTEREARIYIGVGVKNVDRAIASLKRGKMVRTRFATFTAKEI